MTGLSVTLSQIQTARSNVKKHLPETPLLPSPGFSDLFSRTVSIKWDNYYRTGSFKERGVINFLSSVAGLQEKGVCTASAGNHALALSYHARTFGIPCTIVMPRLAPLVKIEQTEANGATVLLEGEDFDEAYERAIELARAEGMIFVPGFNHEHIIAGQGTCGLEILDQSDDFDSIVVPVGGGGLASGIALAVKSVRPDVFILGVQSEWVTNPPARSSAVPEALRERTIADGIAVKNIGSLNKPILERYVDELVSVSDSEIGLAIVRYLELEKTVVEGAGAAAMAALFADKLPPRYHRPVVLACGSNIDINVLARLIGREMRKRERLFRVRVSVPDRPGALASLTQILSTAGANIIDVDHDRHFSVQTSNVDITFLLEVRGQTHKQQVVESLVTAEVSPVVVA